jgi:hypothetical protein
MNSVFLHNKYTLKHAVTYVPHTILVLRYHSFNIVQTIL